MSITLQDVELASNRLKDIVIESPLQLSERLSKIYGAKVYLKREDLQRCRSFKVRGAYNKISSLTKEQQERGIVCASAGNHAQGVAFSCASLGIKGKIFMPLTTPYQKIDRVKYYGGDLIEVVTSGNTYDDASNIAFEYCNTHNSSYVHPFEDYEVICGQATVAKEIYHQLGGKFDHVIVPIGGGGLASGVSAFLKQSNTNINIIGVEPKGAPGMHNSFQHGSPTILDTIETFVDGAAVKQVGSYTFSICRNNISQIEIVPEGKICTTMIDLYQNDGIIVEPAGALSIAGLDFIGDRIKGKTVVCIVSGGNNDILRYPEILERSLIYNGKKRYFIVEFSQKPGQLRTFVSEALGPRDDIVRFEYIKKTNRESGAALVGIEFYDKNDFEPLVERLENSGIHFKILDNEELSHNYIL